MIEIVQWLCDFGQKVSLIFSLPYVFLSRKQQSSDLVVPPEIWMREMILLKKYINN